MQAKYHIKLITNKINLALITVLILFSIIGIVFIYSAASNVHYRDIYAFQLCRSQAIATTLGIGVYLLLCFIDYHLLVRISPFLYIGSIILLWLVLIPSFGIKIYGAQRWLRIIPGLTIQPSEFTKLSTILMVTWCYLKFERKHDLILIFIISIICFIPSLLILKQPDLSTAILFCVIAGSSIFVSRVKLRFILPFIITIVCIFFLVFTLIAYPEKLGLTLQESEKICKILHINTYQKERIISFLNPNKDPLGANWTRLQSEIAIASGGIWGKGYLQGTQNILGFLPDNVSPTDFIFSVLAEESGFIGCTIVICMYIYILLHILYTAWQSVDSAGRIICSVISSLIFTHIFINIGMSIGKLPVTGLPLPFLSYGGSFMIVNMSFMGLVQSINNYAVEKFDIKKKMGIQVIKEFLDILKTQKDKNI